jgi:DNA replication protein DnaC
VGFDVSFPVVTQGIDVIESRDGLGDQKMGVELGADTALQEEQERCLLVKLV